MRIDVKDKHLVFGANHTPRKGAPRGVVLHHAAADGSVESVHDYHRNENGWAGIGYHFYVRKDGTVYRGRPETWMGAHTVGHNDKIGICAEGDFEKDTMSTAQQNALSALLAYLFERYGPMNVYAHRDLDNTACPGKQYPFASIVSGATTDAQGVVREFQTAVLADGLTLPVYGADGIWGEETAQAASRTVQTGSRGARVKLVQSLLIEKGYNLRVYGADGQFGDETDSAVRAFQKKNGLSVDGIVGIKTWKALLGV